MCFATQCDIICLIFFFFQAEDGIRDIGVTGVQTCALPICVGKTTLVGSVSEITPLTTEAVMTSAGVGVDDTRQVPGKLTTTVAMDFGRITIDRKSVV